MLWRPPLDTVLLTPLGEREASLLSKNLPLLGVIFLKRTNVRDKVRDPLAALGPQPNIQHLAKVPQLLKMT